MEGYQTTFCIIDKAFKTGYFDIYLQLLFICIMISVGIFYNVLYVTISNANTSVGCVGDSRVILPCLHSVWAPPKHQVNVYNTSCSSYSSNSNGLSSQNFDDSAVICSMHSFSSYHVPSDMDGNSEAYNPDLDPYVSLQKIRSSNINRLIVGQLNINSLKSKFEGITNLIQHIDILVLTETKLDETFPKNQFLIHGYSSPFCQDRNSNRGGVMIYAREDIPCKMLSKHDTPDDFEGIFLELNLRKVKWFLFGGYNPHKDNISKFVRQLGPIVDTFLSTHDNLLLLGDFDSDTSEFIMKEFCEMYNLKNLIKDPTCYNNPSNPS